MIQSECIALNQPGEGNDFSFLEPFIANKRYIFLGESVHTAKEYSLSKIELIKYLHEEKGFNVVVFEGELGDCLLGNHLAEAEDMTELTFMQGSIGKLWQSSANLLLFDYIIGTKRDQHPLRLAGMDVQQSAGKHLSSYLIHHTRIPEKLRENFQRFDERVNDLLKEDKLHKKKMQPEVNQLIKLGERCLQELKDIDFDDDLLRKGILQSVHNRILYFEANFKKSFSQLFEFRDFMMAKNLEFLSTDIYPEEKIIVWAHNLHVKKRSSSSLLSPYKSSFENLSDTIKEKSAVFGYYAMSGHFGNPFGEDFSVKKVNKSYLEWLLGQSGYPSCFLPCLPIWANTKMKVLESGNIRMNIKPIDQYDGIMFFERISPANFLANELS